MAKIDICRKTSELRIMEHDGRGKEAKSEAIRLLREGFHSRQFLHFVASLLDPPKRGKGNPTRPPKGFIDIGEQFEEMRDVDGITHEIALELIAERFAISESTVETAVRLYREIRDERQNPE